jgi:hypothetical protein
MNIEFWMEMHLQIGKDLKKKSAGSTGAQETSVSYFVQRFVLYIAQTEVEVCLLSLG